MAPKRPKRVLVNYPDGVVEFDGETFPWVVAREPIVVEATEDGLAMLTITLHVERVEVIGR